MKTDKKKKYLIIVVIVVLVIIFFKQPITRFINRMVSSPKETTTMQTTTSAEPGPEFITDEITEEISEVKLSDSCDKVLASGSWNDDYYELVFNSATSVNDDNVYVGIIKNNQWLMELTSSTLFASAKSANTKYYYLGEGCFGMTWYHTPDDPVVDNYYVYNSENGFSIDKVWFTSDRFRSTKAVKDGKFLASVDFKMSIVDVNDKTVKVIPGLKHQDCSECTAYSEGLFFFNGNEIFKRGFYDENMNLKINLENYNVNKESSTFENGVCRFRGSDSSKEVFYFTIDKEGNILSKEPV